MVTNYKKIAIENMAKCSNLDIANNLMDLALKSFTVDTFNFYDYTKLLVIQLIKLVDEGLLPLERVDGVETEIKNLLDNLLFNYKK